MTKTKRVKFHVKYQNTTGQLLLNDPCSTMCKCFFLYFITFASLYRNAIVQAFISSGKSKEILHYFLQPKNYRNLPSLFKLIKFN